MNVRKKMMMDQNDMMMKFVLFSKQATYVANFGLFNPYVVEDFIKNQSNQEVFNCLSKMTHGNLRTSPNLSMFNSTNRNDRIRIIGFASGALSYMKENARSNF